MVFDIKGAKGVLSNFYFIFIFIQFLFNAFVMQNVHLCGLLMVHYIVFAILFRKEV